MNSFKPILFALAVFSLPSFAQPLSENPSELFNCYSECSGADKTSCANHCNMKLYNATQLQKKPKPAPTPQPAAKQGDTCENALTNCNNANKLCSQIPAKYCPHAPFACQEYYAKCKGGSK